MQNAYGGIVNITFIVVFLVIVSGYLAFSVNYNKAFRVKNKMISAIEECEGIKENDDCATQKIEEYIKQIGYSNANNWTADGYTHCPSKKGYCWEEQEAGNSSKELGEKVYYKVTTAVNIDLPILNKILPNMKLFQVSGTTKTFRKR